METQKDVDESKDATIELEEFIEVLSTDDERLSIIGEELSNETGRAILAKLFDGVSSVSEIASSLNISIPLVRWHIQRLSKVNLVRIRDIKMSQKNKEVQHYEPSKFALIIIPSKIMKSTVYAELLKNSLKKIYKHLSVFAVFFGVTTALYLIKTIGQPSGYSYETRAFYGNQLFFINPDLATSLIVGVLSSIAMFVVLKWRSAKKRK